MQEKKNTMHLVRTCREDVNLRHREAERTRHLALPAWKLLEMGDEGLPATAVPDRSSHAGRRHPPPLPSRIEREREDRFKGCNSNGPPELMGRLVNRPVR